jgi:serine/threonine protein kinase
MLHTACNIVFGHGANRSDIFYDKEMGPLLLPAVNEMLSEEIFTPLGTRKAYLVYLEEMRILSDTMVEITCRNLTGYQGEPAKPMRLDRELARELVPQSVAVRFSDDTLPLRLDPLVMYIDSDPVVEVLFLNRERNGKQVEYLSYTTGKVLRDQNMIPEMGKVLSLVTGNPVTSEDLSAWTATSGTENLTTNKPDEQDRWSHLDDYEILAEIGRGGMGVVYLARQLSLGRLVALKMLSDELARDEVALTRFKREMRVLASCEHPNIVKVFANGRLPDGRLYYVMEYIVGSDLDQVWHELEDQTRVVPVSGLSDALLMKALSSASGKNRSMTESRYKSGSGAGQHVRSPVAVSPDVVEPDSEFQVPKLPLPPLPELPSADDDTESYIRHIVALLRDAALAVQTVHNHDVVHRDIKPGNLMLTADGSRIVLMDFGLVKGTDPTMTASVRGGLLGTMRYAAPEQLAAANIKIGPAVDVRGLGVTLWEMLTRRRLFADAADEKQLAMNILEEDIPSLRSIDLGFDRDLEAIVTRATELRVKDRIPTAGKLAEYLQMYLDGLALPIRPLSQTEKVVRWTKRNKGVVSSSVAVTAIVAALSYWAWYQYEYVNPQVSYYADAVMRWGVPQGIIPVSKEERKHRHSTLEFTTTGSAGIVTKVRAIDSHGHCPLIPPITSLFWMNTISIQDIGNILNNPSSIQSPCSMEIGYSQNNKIDYFDLFDRNNQFLYKFKYQNPTMGCFYNKDGYLAKEFKSSTCIELERSQTGLDAGLDKKNHFTDLNGNPLPDADGIFANESDFNELGQTTKVTYLDSQDKKTGSSLGLSEIKVDYDNKGKIKELVIVDVNSKEKILDGFDFSRVAFSYDDYDNIVEFAFIGVNGEPGHYKNENSFSKHFLSYDNVGNVIEEKFFDINGRPVKNIDSGYDEIKVTYDEKGNQVEVAIFGADEKLILGKNGVAKAVLVYDDRSNKLEEAYFGINGEPVISNETGAAKVTYIYDDKNNKLEEACFGVDGQPVLTKGGMTKVTYVYDDKNNKLEEAYFGVDGQPVLSNGGGIAKTIYAYDDRSNKLEETYFGINGESVFSKEGCAKIATSYDKNNNKTSNSCEGSNGEPILSKSGFSKVAFVYDNKNNQISKAYYGLNNELILDDVDGYAKATWKYENDKVSEEAFFGIDGRLMLGKDGYAKTIQSYDSRGYLTDVAYFGVDGQPMLWKDGYAKVIYFRDDKGNRAGSAYYGVDGKPMRGKNGYAKMIFLRDEKKNLTGMAFYDIDGKLMMSKDGYAKIINLHDEKGNTTETTVFGMDDKPINGEQGYATIKRAYDKNKLTEESFLGEDNKSIINNDGYAKDRIAYDNKGNQIEIMFLGLDDKPIIGRDGYAKMRSVYDDKGNQIEIMLLGLDDKPIIGRDGYAKMHHVYDDNGNLIEIAYFGADGKPIIAKVGYAKTHKIFDQKGDEIELAFFGVDGRLMLIKDGYAKVVYKSARGNCQYFDDKGNKIDLIFKVVVDDLIDDGQAKTLGISVGDIITHYDDQPVSSMCQVHVATQSLDNKLKTITVMRDGKTITFSGVKSGKLGVIMKEMPNKN